MSTRPGSQSGSNDRSDRGVATSGAIPSRPVVGYPDWFYPSHAEPPPWVAAFVAVVEEARPSIESRSVNALTSDQVLAFLRPGLVALGYEVEAGKRKSEKITAVA